MTLSENDAENRAEHPSSAESDSRRRITSKRELRDVRGEQSSTTEQHVPRRISCAVALTTQEALDRNRVRAMRIANVEIITLNWVSIS